MEGIAEYPLTCLVGFSVTIEIVNIKSTRERDKCRSLCGC